MSARTTWQRMILNDGKQYNVNIKYAPALVEMHITVTDHTGAILGTAKVCRHFYFTFELFKNGRKRTGKRRVSKYTESHDPKEYGATVANWIVKKHIPRYTD